MKEKKKPKKNRFFNNFCYDFIKITGALPILLMLRTKVIYQTNKSCTRGPILISANHIGMMDPIIVLTVFPWIRPHFLAADNMFKTKIGAAFFNLLYCIKTDRQNFSVSAFHTVIERLENGAAVVVFPEGQINKTEKSAILPFKAGISLMAYKAKAPILPLYIVKRKKWYQRQTVIIGEPIDLHEILGEKPSIEQITGASELLQEKEFELHNYYEERLNRAKRKSNRQRRTKHEQRDF